MSAVLIEFFSDWMMAQKCFKPKNEFEAFYTSVNAFFVQNLIGNYFLTVLYLSIFGQFCKQMRKNYFHFVFVV